MTSPPDRVRPTKVLILDADDTIWSREPLTRKNWAVVADIFDIDLEALMSYQASRRPVDVFEHYRTRLADPRLDRVPRHVSLPPEYKGESDYFVTLAHWYRRQLSRKIPPDADIRVLPGAQELVLEAHSAGVILAINTSAESQSFQRIAEVAMQTPEARSRFPHLPLRGFRFPEETIYINGDTHNGPGKPHPSTVETILRLAECTDDPLSAIMCGDAWSDVLPGHLAGTRTVALGTGRLKTAGAWPLTREGVRFAAAKEGLVHRISEDSPLPQFADGLDEVRLVTNALGLAVVAVQGPGGTRNSGEEMQI